MPGVSAFRLGNGLELVVIEDHRAPAVTQMIWYKVGAADEVAGKSGLAHFLEHLMFKGTKTVPSGAFSARVAAGGGNDNAFTSWDYTAYYQEVAAPHLPEVMAMEADRMAHLRLSEEDVTTERQVILEERGQRVDSDPQAVLDEQARAMLFQNHRYGVPVIGWRHEMEGLTREDALAWYRRYYAPNNAVLILAGDVTPEAALALAETHYGPIPPVPEAAPAPRAEEPPAQGARRLTLKDARVSTPLFTRLYRLPARRSGAQEEAAAFTLLSALLGGNGTTSALARSLQFDTPQAVWTAASYGGLARGDAVLEISAAPLPDVPLEALEKGMDAVITKLAAEGPSEADLARVKVQVAAAEIYGLDSAARRARRYGAALASGLTLDDIAAWPGALQQVTAAEVQKAAAQLLDESQAVTAYLLPEKAAP